MSKITWKYKVQRHWWQLLMRLLVVIRLQPTDIGIDRTVTLCRPQCSRTRLRPIGRHSMWSSPRTDTRSLASIHICSRPLWTDDPKSVHTGIQKENKIRNSMNMSMVDDIEITHVWCLAIAFVCILECVWNEVVIFALIYVHLKHVHGNGNNASAIDIHRKERKKYLKNFDSFSNRRSARKLLEFQIDFETVPSEERCRVCDQPFLHMAMAIVLWRCPVARVQATGTIEIRIVLVLHFEFAGFVVTNLNFHVELLQRIEIGRPALLQETIPRFFRVHLFRLIQSSQVFHFEFAHIQFFLVGEWCKEGAVCEFVSKNSLAP